MELNWIEALILLLGSGGILSFVTLIHNWHQSKLEREIQERREKTAEKIQDRREAASRDFEIRKQAKRYYRKLYAYIAIFDELIQGYHRSVSEKGEAKIFTKEGKYTTLNSDKILEEFRLEYEKFLKFYIKTKWQGYEIYIPKTLQEMFQAFWIKVDGLYENNNDLKDKTIIADVHDKVVEITEHIEKIFGLEEK